MNYKKIHDSIIDRAKNRVYDKNIHHNHHIIPKHENSFSKETVPLTYKEHMIIHHLLWKINNTTGDKLAYLRFKGMTETFFKEKAIYGGKIGGKKTKENKSGIFSEDYDRSFETKRRWKNNIITKDMLNITPEIAKERGLKSFLSKKGIHDPNYDRTKQNKLYWNSLNEEEKNEKIKHLKKQSKIGGMKSKENKSGFHGLSEKEKIKNASKGGKSHVGKKWINREGKNLRVPAILLDSYIENGWKLGLLLKENKK